jgi:hypothetical protein
VSARVAALAVAATAVALSGCSTSHPPKTIATATASTSTSSASVSSSPSDSPSAADASSYPVPACSAIVDQKVSDYVTPTGGPRCITGASLATDDTGWGVQTCTDTHSRQQIKVYFWLSNKATAPDTAEYIGREDGYVEVLADASAASPAIVAQIYIAAGCV